MDRNIESISEYHIHVYFDLNSSSAQKAKQVRESLPEKFGDKVVIGTWHEKTVGPHPKPMYQVKFKPEYFKEIVQWMSLNATGLSILIHPETGDELSDHTDHALWLGKQMDLVLDVFKPRPVSNKKAGGYNV